MNESYNEKNKRIAKNTLYLYARTAIVMGISLYTSRVILKALGESDFGIYNLVGSAVVLFTFINSAMTSSSQRYLNVAIAQKKEKNIQKVFSSSAIIHLLIAGIFITLAETVGLWFVTTKLNIPPQRENAAFWVYQITIFNTCFSTIRCPYNAVIIAYERMDFFAQISIFEAIFKLGISFAILYTPFDRLIFYSLLLLLSSILVALLCKRFCDKNFSYIRIAMPIDKSTVRSMMGFSLWSLLGSGALMISNQGISMLLNISFNVIVNAAIGIAYQVNTAASTLVSNFQTAFMPQITKSYASGESSYLNKLIFNTSRYSFLLWFLISYPIFFNCEAILHFWLTDYPEFTSGLVKVIIICVGFDALCGPLWMVAHAKGNIRNYQIIVSTLLLSTLITCYIAVKIGYSPEVAFGSRIIVLVLLYIFRIFYTKNAIGLSILKYSKEVCFQCILIILGSLPFAMIVHFSSLCDLAKITLDCFAVTILICLCGFNSSEKNHIVMYFKKIISKR